MFPVGLPSQDPLSLPTTTILLALRASQPGTLAFKYIPSQLPKTLFPIEATREEHLNPSPGLQAPHNGHTVFTCFCMWH